MHVKKPILMEEPDMASLMPPLVKSISFVYAHICFILNIFFINKLTCIACVQKEKKKRREKPVCKPFYLCQGFLKYPYIYVAQLDSTFSSNPSKYVWSSKQLWLRKKTRKPKPKALFLCKKYQN